MATWGSRPRWIRWGAYILAGLLALSGLGAVVGEPADDTSEPAGTLPAATIAMTSTTSATTAPTTTVDTRATVAATSTTTTTTSTTTVAGLALAACGGSTETSAPTTAAPVAAATVAPAATAAPVAPAAPASTTAPADTEGAAEATSCPVGYIDFDGVYPLRICHKGATVISKRCSAEAAPQGALRPGAARHRTVMSARMETWPGPSNGCATFL